MDIDGCIQLTAIADVSKAHNSWFFNGQCGWRINAVRTIDAIKANRHEVIRPITSS